MNYTELIYEYLDGELNPLLEDRLFSEMSVNQDLRSEFARQIKINNYAMQDMNSIQVPSEATSALFANLGFSIPAASVPRSKFPYYFSFLKNYKLNKIVPTLLILLVGISGGLILRNGNKTALTDKQEQKNIISRVVTNSNTPVNSRLLINEIPMSSSGTAYTDESSMLTASTANDNLNHQAKVFKKVNIVNNNTEKNNTAKNYTHNTLNNISDNYSLQSKENIILKENNISLTNKPIYENPSIYSSNYPHQELSPVAFNNVNNAFSGNIMQPAMPLPGYYYSQNANVNSRFELTFNTRAYRISKQIQLADSKSFFSGSSVSLMYKLNDENYIGGEFGEDEFYQEYTYNNGDQNILYRQMPNYFWGAVSYKYAPAYLKLYEVAQIYAKSSIGGCKAGAVGKLQLGMNIPISQSVNAFLGGEYSALLFNIRNQIYNSNKFEILYGVSVNL